MCSGGTASASSDNEWFMRSVEEFHGGAEKAVAQNTAGQNYLD